jgi:hypothetical protein
VSAAEIDMRVPENFAKAISLALASTETEGWGEMLTKDLHAIAGTSEKLWSVWKDQDRPDGASVVAITGNGPTSEANAEFFVNAKKIVLGLVSEVDRLQTILRNAGIAT